jgi:hypothetical protein
MQRFVAAPARGQHRRALKAAAAAGADRERRARGRNALSLPSLCDEPARRYRAVGASGIRRPGLNSQERNQQYGGLHAPSIAPRSDTLLEKQVATTRRVPSNDLLLAMGATPVS